MPILHLIIKSVLLDNYWIIQLTEYYRKITTVQQQIGNAQENLTNCEQITIYSIFGVQYSLYNRTM